MKFFRLVPLLALFLSVGPSFAQPKFEATALSMREALRRGEIREFISFMEAKAEEAEKNGNWDEAARAYNLASLASRHNGQLQKAISHGNKGLEIAEKLKDPVLQTEALYYLSLPYFSLGLRAKAVELSEKALELSKAIPQPLPRQIFQGLLYNLLGFDFMRRGELQKAIEYASHSVAI